MVVERSAARGSSFLSDIKLSWSVVIAVFHVVRLQVRPWSKNDIVGVLLDLTAGELRFWLNGVDCGVAYSGIAKDDASGELSAASFVYSRSPSTQT